MKEKLIIRSLRSKIVPYVEHYTQFQRKWLTRDDGVVMIIEGYLHDTDFQSFAEYLRTRIPYMSTSVERLYTRQELQSARLLRMWIRATFEPAGEEVGTRYRYPCSVCEAGRTVQETLLLNLGKVPKGKDIVKTIAMDEWIVSKRLAELIVNQNITGAELKPARHYTNRAIKGRWYQLSVSSIVRVSEETILGEWWTRGKKGQEVRTACGHAIGSIAYSELFIKEGSWDGSDIVRTDFYFGGRLNLINFYPYILISQRFYRLLTEHKIKGYEVEVAHLVT